MVSFLWEKTEKIAQADMTGGDENGRSGKAVSFKISISQWFIDFCYIHKNTKLSLKANKHGKTDRQTDKHQLTYNIAHKISTAQSLFGTRDYTNKMSYRRN